MWLSKCVDVSHLGGIFESSISMCVCSIRIRYWSWCSDVTAVVGRGLEGRYVLAKHMRVCWNAYVWENGAGYDQDGKNQLKGSVVGTNKWIGTSGEIVEHVSVVWYLIWTLALDIYALLSRQGIP
jgi:hypothetical protein